jgi:exo-1,4-beta-D-glucosaminidase
MLSNPWPSLIWHTYDYYLYPGGTYFGMKKSMELLHVQYSYKSGDVVVVNSTLNPYSGLQLKADRYNGKGELLYTRSSGTNIGPDTAIKCFQIPASSSEDPVQFLRLEMKDKEGKSISINWYWLSSKQDSLNWPKSKWFYTPQSSFAGFQDLESLPLTSLSIRTQFTKNGENNVGELVVKNTSKAVAFFVHLRVLNKKGGSDILPIIFDDNYICLAPGESRIIHCHWLQEDAPDSRPFVSAEGWNLDLPACKADVNSEFTKD